MTSSNIQHRWNGRCLLMAASLALAACSGGSDGGSTNPPPAADEPLSVRAVASADIGTLADGSPAVMSELLAVTSESLSSAAASAIFARHGLTIVGQVPEAGLYQLALPAKADETTLEGARSRLANEAGIFDVSLHLVSQSHAAAITPATTIVPAAKLFPEQSWAFNQVNAPGAYAKLDTPLLRLSPVKVGVIDTGFVRTEPNIKFATLYGETGLQLDAAAVPPVIPAGLDFRADGDRYYDAYEKRHHGMHVAGIIAGAADGTLTSGLAWKTSIELHGAKTDGTVSTMVHLARLARQGVRVVNISSGFSRDVSFDNVKAGGRNFALFAERLTRRYDVLMVFAAGNEARLAEEQSYLGGLFTARTNCLGLAQADCKRLKDRVLIVGATDGQRGADKRPLFASEYSNHGNAIEIVAPGGALGCTGISSFNPRLFSQNYLVATSPPVTVPPCSERPGIASLGAEGNRILMSGTSQAAPMVAAAAAMVLAANPALLAHQVKSVLLASAKPSAYDAVRLREYPLLDVAGAIDAALNTVGVTLPPGDASDALLLFSLGCAYGTDSAGRQVPGRTVLGDVDVKLETLGPDGKTWGTTASARNDVNGAWTVVVQKGIYRLQVSIANDGVFKPIGSPVTIDPALRDGIRWFSYSVAHSSQNDCTQDGTWNASETFGMDDAAPLTSGAIDLLSFDDCTAADSSGFARNGTITGTSCVTGRHGQALKFANPGLNVGGGSDWVEMLPHTGDAVTFSAWINWAGDATSGNEYAGAIWSLGTHTVGPFISLWINEGSGKVWTDRYTTSPYKLVPGEWRMITIASDGSSETLYIDGTPVNTATYDNPISFNGQASYLSRHFWAFGSNAARFRGTIDDVRVYDRMLSDTEVRNLYDVTKN